MRSPKKHLRRGGPATQEFFQLFFEKSGDGIWCAQLDRPLPANLRLHQKTDFLMRNAYLNVCNKSFARMYGYADPPQMRGMRLPQLVLGSDPQNISNLKRFLSEKYRIIDAVSHEVDRGGADRFFLNSVFGIVERGRLVRIWGVQRDITGKQTERQKGRVLVNKLTREQGIILELTMEGWSLKEIGGRLRISPKTVATHRYRLMKKLGVRDMVSLVREALRLNLVHLMKRRHRETGAKTL